MENSIQTLINNLNISRDDSIKIYNLICDEINEKYDHDSVIIKVNNIINHILNNEGDSCSYDETLDKLGK